ncbi:hypothetical protein QE152_g1043 [Popillia japonica]|uniref:Uncharacterized protein n=1 Tax=Popillia japonica TaxID=7064 RepID=A0AAW1N3M9_POPJA
MRQIKTLEHENAMLNDAINKVKKNLLKLEEKADRYLEERDQFKRKHNESLEMIETLQRENVRSKEALETLEDEKKANLNKLHVSMVEELEVCEKKHRDSLEQLDNLRYELEKYKTENNSSLIKVQTLSDENRNQAETIAALQEELRKSMEKPVTTSIGVNANAQIKDIGVDSYPPHTKHVSIGYAPETKTVGIFGNVDGEIVPRQYKTVSCGTELPHRQITFHPDDCTTTTSMNTCDEERPTDIVTVGKAPAKKKKDAVEILELLEPTTLEAYGCGSKVKEDVFDFVPHKLTATADKKRIRDAMKVEMLAHGRRIVIEPQYHQSSKAPCAETRKLQLQPKSHQAEILYTNPEGMYQTSNESMVSDASGAVSLEGEKPLKSVRINPNVSLPVKTSVSDEDEAVVYLSPKEHRGGTAERPPQPKLVYVSRDEDAQHREGAEERPPQTKSAMRNGEGSSRSTSPKRSKTPSSNPAEDLQNVVQDLNESVSRIIEKTPNEKACREKIAKLEAQLRATLKQKDRDIEVERQKRNQEVENLKLTIREMEKALQNKQENSANLQGAVDLYLNSISVLEQSEERYRNEVAQQRVTISNLQEALVAAKQQLDELREKCQRDLELKCNLLDILDVSLNDLEKQCYHYYNQFINSLTTIEYLRDEMLDMEVEKFELLEDVLVLEARLLKYQQVSKQYEGKYLGSECSEYCIKQNESVVTLAQDTICYTEDLQCQMSVLETALKREQKINVVQASRIEELQNIIGLKNLELSRVNDAYQDSKNKLDAATNKSKNLEDAIRELQEQLNEMELDNMYQEEKTDICHGELDMCLNNLQSVKLKMRSQYKIMCQKMQEFAQLQADCKIHANNAEMFKRDLENTRIRFRDEVIELKHNIRDLKEKLHNSDDKIEELNKEIKHSQALLVEASHHETKIKQDFHMREQQLTEKIHSAQSEEMRLLDVVTQLEQQILDMRNDLDAKGAQLETAKQTILQMNSDSLMKQHTTQEEINSLKNEINTLLQKLGAHKADNERLQQQIECMKCCVRQNESDNNSLKMQLDKCLNDLKNAEQEKIYLEQRNMTLMGTLDKMQATIQSKSESIAHMEFELLEAKTSRDEICTESRNVVFNVRAWLDEQKRINEQLKEKLEKKDALIMKYEQERSFSKKGSRCICNSRPGYPRQRGGAQPPPYFENAPPLSRSPWSLDSRGSGSESPTSSVSSTAADWYEYEEVGYDAIIEEPTAELWVHRVESMTEELQRSNRYWKRKINDSEFMVTKDK